MKEPSPEITITTQTKGTSAPRTLNDLSSCAFAWQQKRNRLTVHHKVTPEAVKQLNEMDIKDITVLVVVRCLETGFAYRHVYELEDVRFESTGDIESRILEGSIVGRIKKRRLYEACS